MDQHQQSMTNPEQDGTFSVIAIPEHLREQVEDYVAQLTQEDADVSGYMLRGMASPAMGAKLMGGFSGTNCTITNSGAGQDINCLDTN